MNDEEIMNLYDMAIEFGDIKIEPDIPKNECPLCKKILDRLNDRDLCKNCGYFKYYPYPCPTEFRPMKGWTYNRKYHVNKLLRESDLPYAFRDMVRYYFLKIQREYSVRYDNKYLPKYGLIFNKILNDLMGLDQYKNFFKINMKKDKIEYHEAIINDILRTLFVD